MSKSQEWKDKRAALLPARKDRAKKILARAGIEVIDETKNSLIVKVNCATVEYYPFTGGFRGTEGIGGRGLDNLIALKK